MVSYCGDSGPTRTTLFSLRTTMDGENRMNRWSLRNNRLKFIKTLGGKSSVLHISIAYHYSYSQQWFVGLTIYFTKYSTYPIWMCGIYCAIPPIPQNIAMDMNNVMINFNSNWWRKSERPQQVTRLDLDARDLKRFCSKISLYNDLEKLEPIRLDLEYLHMFFRCMCIDFID